MANENKNIKELVSDDDDPTAELEIRSFQAPVDSEDLHADRESDAHTCGLGDSDDADIPGPQTIPELQSDLKSRTRTIGQLQYDIQQLRSKWLGLEAEISAREEIVNNLLNDNDTLTKKVGRKHNLLKKRSASIKALKSEIRQREENRLLLEDKLATQAPTDEESARSRDAAERELEDALTEIETAHSAMADTEKRLQQRDQEYGQLEQQLGEQLEMSAEQSTALEKAQLELEGMHKELESATQEEQNLNSEINQRDDLENTLEQKITGLEEQLGSLGSTEAEYAAELQASRQEVARLNLELETALHQSAAQIAQTQKTTSSVVKELQAQLEKTEQYADSLRFNLQDSNDALTKASKRSDTLGKEAATLAARNVEQAVELDSVNAANEELLVSIEQLSADQAQELRTLRFELTEAQDSVAQTGDINTQLVSDLVSTRSFKEELERMLMRTEEDAQDRITDLEQKVKQLSGAVEEFEQKLDTKNTAINVLLGELAKKSEQLESIGEIEEVIQEIDTRMSERFDEQDTDAADQRGRAPVTADRDRITRVLIGNIGEQELRFPLFKKRLTIGRTADNDIQLKTSFISRRHAVVLTEGDATRVIDWGSKNGVYVNAERVTERFLANGDIVAVGNAKFRYEERPKREA